MKKAIVIALAMVSGCVNPKTPPAKTTVGKEAISFHVTGSAGKPGQVPTDLRESVRQRLVETGGVLPDTIVVWQHPEDPEQNVAMCSFDQKVTTRNLIAIKMRDSWEIEYWECGSCGNCTDKPGACCATRMNKRP